jgi:hypothetical protein
MQKRQGLLPLPLLCYRLIEKNIRIFRMIIKNFITITSFLSAFTGGWKGKNPPVFRNKVLDFEKKTGYL